MAVEIVTREDLQLFKTELIAEIRALFQQTPKQEPEWLRSSHARKMLSVSPNTLQSLRISGKLRFTKVGSIIYYRRDDIQRLLEGGR